MVTDIVFDGTAFSVTHWAQFSKEEFVQEGLSNAVFKDYSNDERQQMLIMVYQIINDL